MWTPKYVQFHSAKFIARRLIDHGRFDELEMVVNATIGNLFAILAFSDELMQVGEALSLEQVKPALDSLLSEVNRPEIKMNGYDHNELADAMMSVLETCAKDEAMRTGVLEVLTHYSFAKPQRLPTDHYLKDQRRLFLRGFTLHSVLLGLPQPSISDLKKEFEVKDPVHSSEDNAAYSFESQIPFYYRRVQLICGESLESHHEFISRSSTARYSGGYRSFDFAKSERVRMYFEVLMWTPQLEDSDITLFLDRHMSSRGESFWLQDQLFAFRAAARLDHLEPLRASLEQLCATTIGFPSASESPQEKSDYYVLLSRAVYSLSSNDAAVYFLRGIETSDRFGEEIVPRWNAMISLARVASSESISQRLCYKFVRCAELVGENIEREKYWDRDEVFEVALDLNAPVALSALSRWRDRDVGYFDDHLRRLVIAGLDKNIFSEEEAWCLSGFSGCNSSFAIVRRIIEGSSPDIQQIVFNQFVRDLELYGLTQGNLNELRLIVSEMQIDDQCLREALTRNNCELKPVDAKPNRSRPSVTSDLNVWSGKLTSVNPNDVEDLRRAFELFLESDYPRDFQLFFVELISSIERGSEIILLDCLFYEADVVISSYQAPEIIETIKTQWGSIVSVKKKWLKYISRIGYLCAASLADAGGLSYFLERVEFSSDEDSALKLGVIDGVRDLDGSLNQSQLFGFVSLLSESITPSEGHELLDYALCRFDEHVVNDYGDGNWGSWLTAPESALESLSAFIWAALGSPDSRVRWEAAHCVLRAINIGCVGVVEQLVKFYDNKDCVAFMGNGFPFYDLYAKLYLLIGFNRGATNRPDLLLSHSEFFQRISLETPKHILIDVVAAEVALKLELTFVGTYSADVTRELRNVGTSQIQPRNISREGELLDNPLYSDHDDSEGELFLGVDFDAYWIPALARVFGLSKKELGSSRFSVGSLFILQNINFPGNEV